MSNQKDGVLTFTITPDDIDPETATPEEVMNRLFSISITGKVKPHVAMEIVRKVEVVMKMHYGQTKNTQG